MLGIAIAAIFIPVIFMQGIVGKFFYQYGITVTVAGDTMTGAVQAGAFGSSPLKGERA